MYVCLVNIQYLWYVQDEKKKNQISMVMSQESHKVV